MSCSKECFDPDDKWANHDECATCPGQDSGPMKDGKIFCAKCSDWHSREEWPHEPNKATVENFL